MSGAQVEPMTAEEYQEALAACGGEQTPLSDAECRAWLQGWREVYAAGLHAATGQWRLGGFDWHVFSFKHARALNGLRALSAYKAEQPKSLIVCPALVGRRIPRLTNDRVEGEPSGGQRSLGSSNAMPAVRLEHARLPVFAGRGADLLVAPPDLAWTMAFTHEESLDIGPYFSRRDWIVSGRAAPRRRRC